MVTESREGLASAIESVGPGEPPADDAEQLPLLPVQGATPAAAQDAGGADRGPGRPRGSRNRRTEAWQDYLLGQYTSPLESLARIVSRPLAELRAELHCSWLDAAKLQLQAAKELAPYIHQKLPQAIELDSDALMFLAIGKMKAGTPEAEALDAARMSMDLIEDEESGEYQILSGGEDGKSEIEKSDGDDK